MDDDDISALKVTIQGWVGDYLVGVGVTFNRFSDMKSDWLYPEDEHLFLTRS